MTVTNEQASKLQTIAKGLRNLLAEAEEVVAMSEDMDGRMEVYGAVSKIADAIHAVEEGKVTIESKSRDMEEGQKEIYSRILPVDMQAVIGAININE